VLTATELLVVIALLLAVAAAVEYALHKRALNRIKIRIHVNGTRGKSSVTRLIAAGLREGGLVTCAKTTGTLARMILPNGREVPIFRPAGANVIEQKRIVAAAVAHGADALVIECMALQPELQALSEFKLLRATHGVITNARPDHLDVMGPTGADVARALCGMIPPKGRLFTAERSQLSVIESAARDRDCRLQVTGLDEIASIDESALAGFSYTEHADNVALALAVCESLDVKRDVALRGMHKARPDPGALTRHALDYFGRRIVFFNAFAANDPVSTEQLWELAIQRTPGVETRIAVFNCRSDRADRSVQLGTEFCDWTPPDHVVLIGSGTHFFARAAGRAGFDLGRLVFAEDLPVHEIFERIVGLVERSALIIGMGNIGGHGLSLVRHFKNRSQPGESQR
jgi:poly-gamma-glutamate synthase PgsB/CapB